MSVKTLHPSITPDRQYEWALSRDAASGESAVKSRGEVYLPKPSGFRAAPDGGRAYYDAYRTRAQFPEIVAPSIASMIGIIHAKEVQIEMPDALASIVWDSATNDAVPVSLDAFHRRITRALLTLGRFAVLADAPADGGEPYLVGYDGDALINWDRDFYVLDETAKVRTGFEWRDVPRFRVLQMVDGAYSQQVYEGDNLELAETLFPVMRGGKPFAAIPINVASSVDLTPRIITPPLIGVSRAALAIYQLSADYRWQLFMSGQETLVAINGDAPTMVGAGAVHKMMGGEGSTPDLKYVSPSCSGIEAHKEAMEENRKAAVNAGARLFDGTDRAQESGEARKMRFASETATLLSVAQNSCGLLERGLRDCALIMGLNPDEVIVTPPADLMDASITPAEMGVLFGVYERGGMSWDTYYSAGQKGGIFSPDRDADEELALLDKTDDQEGAELPRQRGDAAQSKE